MTHHAYPIAQNSPATKRTIGIDRNDTDRFAGRANDGQQFVDVLLPAPGGPVNPTTHAEPVGV
jgi:hypothetical protein